MNYTLKCLNGILRFNLYNIKIKIKMTMKNNRRRQLVPFFFCSKMYENGQKTALLNEFGNISDFWDRVISFTAYGCKMRIAENLAIRNKSYVMLV